MSVNTVCRDCVFASYEGNTQTGCRLGKLELLVANGGKPDSGFDYDEEAYQEQVDERLNSGMTLEEAESLEPTPIEGGRTFSIVQGRSCLWCRHAEGEWAKQFPEEKWEEQVLSEVKLRMDYLVPVEDESLEDILLTLGSIARQSLKTGVTHILLTTKKFKAFEVIRAVNARSLGLDYQVRTLHEDCKPGGAVPRVIDIELNTLDYRKAVYYAVFRPGYRVPNSFAASIDSFLHEKLGRFLVLLPKWGQGLVVMTRMHQLVGGNAACEHDEEDGTTINVDSVQDKIRLMCRDDDNLDLIREVGDVCLYI